MRTQNERGSVRWADGTYDSQRGCSECGLETCPFPVHTDRYKEIIISMSYWNWMQKNNMKEGANGEILKDNK